MTTGRAPTLQTLPESALTRIMELCGKAHGPSICAVCKSWNTLFFSSPGLWRALPLDGRRAARAGKLLAWLVAKRTLLARLGPLVAAVDARLGDPEAGFGQVFDDGNSDDEVDDATKDEEGSEAGGGEAGGGEADGSLWELTNALLQALSPSLSELRLTLECKAHGAEALALPTLPHLARLHLDLARERAAEALQPAAAAWLAQLPNLEAFSWHGPATDPSPALAGALGALSGLTALELRVSSQMMVSEGRLSPETGAAIAGLTALRSLSIDAALIEPEVVAATAGLPHLTALSLSGVPDGAAMAQLTALSQLRHLSLAASTHIYVVAELPAPAAFPALVSFQAGRPRGVARLQMAGASLCRCSWDGRAGELELEGLAGLRSWAQLLGMLLPPAGNAPLRTLRIERSELPAGALVVCPPLHEMTQLLLHRCTDSAGDGNFQPATRLSGAAASALLHSAPHLESLGIVSCLQDEFPAALTTMRSLTRLDLTDNGLTNLPPGDWLADLKALALSSNSFTALPPALAGATALTALELTGNWQLCLDAAAADVLSQLSQLSKVNYAAGRVNDAFR